MHSEQNSHTNFENPKSLCNVPCSYSHHHRPSTQHFKSNRNVYHSNTSQLACWHIATGLLTTTRTISATHYYQSTKQMDTVESLLPHLANNTAACIISNCPIVTS